MVDNIKSGENFKRILKYLVMTKWLKKTMPGEQLPILPLKCCSVRKGKQQTNEDTHTQPKIMLFLMTVSLIRLGQTVIYVFVCLLQMRTFQEAKAMTSIQNTSFRLQTVSNLISEKTLQIIDVFFAILILCLTCVIFLNLSLQTNRRPGNFI